MGNGSSWDFQASEALKQEFKDAIRDHFKFWKAGQLDKTRIPQYFILAGAGEGKSRTAQELQKLLIECTNDADLQNRLRSTLVFNLTFENGTKLSREVETNSDYAIVTSLQPPRINSNPVFVDNPVMKMLINDMGGHGRALEALEESINGKDLDNINFVDLINDNFVAQFRSLKSNIYGDDVQVKLRVIHNGAKHNFGDSSIYNRKLTLEQSVKRVSTKSGIYKQDVKILCQDGEVDVTEARHIIINAPNAESGDSFCSIKMAGTGLLQTETHQCKLVKQIISQERFKDEHEKATSPEDTFILCTSASSEKLEPHQPMSAIVSKDNWEEYFGSFAGRCYNYAREPPNVNEGPTLS
ncbi:1471_t:CDS:2 [Acaulospora colombiana]|uniref:1471_t:CDS:1 n=1 Tax=Acaulospora colombiana TaxID=27376 RepID=A0ACA9K776_9GLOM|nr:1471_t:CDS:2 [Acaulospora colombiana]